MENMFEVVFSRICFQKMESSEALQKSLSSNIQYKTGIF